MYQLDFEHPSHVYFVGIGGVSMSGLALVLKQKGFRVSGSDRARSAECSHLEENGITVYYGQRASNMTDDIDCVIITSAIREDNPEYQETVRRKLPMLSRGELMGQLMKRYAMPVGISGTHGKTTTTSMLGEILMKADTDPTLFAGGNLKSIHSNVRIGSRPDFFLTEACEYTNSFLSFAPKGAIILNIEEDHLDFFKDLADIRRSFRKYAELVPDDGCLVIHKDIENLEELTAGLTCRVLTFSLEQEADYTADNICIKDGVTFFTVHNADGRERDLSLKVPGRHNLCNALAALAMADFLGVPEAVSAGALAEFEGTDRRFEHKGTLCGVEIYDDYAHHPSEIKASLTVAKDIAKGRVWCVFQPHTYSRTKALLSEFADALCLADQVVLADIYAARETDTLGISSATLMEEIRALGHSCSYFPSFDEIETYLLENCINQDMLITMGAGDVYKIGEKLLGKK